jgi:cytochrome d ubiquinol oxidase subunit II
MVPRALAGLERFPAAWAIVVLTVLAIGYIPRAVFHGQASRAFLASSTLIVSLVALVGVALFPNLVTSSLDPAWSLTIHNAASSQKTLGIMAIIAAMGMPFVLAYTAIIYWTFRGKVQLGEHSY